jgi:hypothetical protein
LQENLARQFTAIGQPLYDGLHDLDGNGAINILDWAAVRDRMGAALPAGNPGGSPAAPSPIAADAAMAVSAREVVRPSSATLRAAIRRAVSEPAHTQTPRTASDSNGGMTALRRASRSAVRTAATVHDQILADWTEPGS